jgi:parallel beta-helix repeat protein
MKAPRGSVSGRLATLAAGLVMLFVGTSQAAAASPPLVITSDATLDADYNGQIIVVGQGATLNCAGHTVTGDGIGVGVNVQADGVSVTDCHVQGFETGILTGRRATQILDNGVTHDGQGIRVAGASGDTVAGNSANDNDFWGIIVTEGASGNTVEDNSANNNRLIGIALNTASDNLVAGNSANHNGETGVDLLLSSRNQILDTAAMHNGNAGFEFSSSSGNAVTGNAATNNGTPGDGVGFNFNDSSSNTVSDNLAFRNGGVGFFTFFGSEFNVFTGNRACQNFFVDAADISTGAGNTWSNNNFCTSDLP